MRSARSSGLIIALALAGASPLLQAADPVETARTRHTAADTPVELRAHAHWNSECRPAAPPSVTWVENPAHGRVEQHEDQIPATANAGGSGRSCEGVMMRGVRVTYTPETGFHGTDHVSYDLRYTPKEPVVHYAYDIKVD